MAVIGIFTPTKEGGWSGTIKTLTINAKVRFVPNDNRENDRAPLFRIFVGMSELGAAWMKKGKCKNSREYLSVRIDDPGLTTPIQAALLLGGGAIANLVWKRVER